MENNNQSENKVPFFICPKCRTHYDPIPEHTHCKICDDVKLMTCEEYRLYKVDIVKKQRAAREAEAAAKQAAKEAAEQKALLKQQNTPKCPTCGSTNIRHISTLNRATSILALGIFSSKIGKSYECLNCKAKW